MPIWTTYLSNWANKQDAILAYLRAFDNSHGVFPKFVMLNRGNNAIAPTPDLLHQYKSSNLSWAVYELVYNKILLSVEAYDWMAQAVVDAKTLHVVLICFEKSPERCHRRLLAEKIKVLFPEVDYRGELPNSFPVMEVKH